jgi:hypothetical protein
LVIRIPVIPSSNGSATYRIDLDPYEKWFDSYRDTIERPPRSFTMLPCISCRQCPCVDGMSCNMRDLEFRGYRLMKDWEIRVNDQHMKDHLVREKQLMR